MNNEFYKTFFGSGWYEYKYVVLNDGRVVFITKSRYAPDGMFLGEETHMVFPITYEESAVARLATDKEIIGFASRRYDKWALRREIDMKVYDTKLEECAEIIKEHTKE
jgi:hypothetical protein